MWQRPLQTLNMLERLGMLPLLRVARDREEHTVAHLEGHAGVEAPDMLPCHADGGVQLVDVAQGRKGGIILGTTLAGVQR